MGAGGVFDQVFVVHDAQADAGLRLEDHAAALVAQVEPGAQVGHKHDGEFEALALVDRHDADYVVVFAARGCGRRPLLAFFDHGHESQETVQALPLKTAEPAGKRAYMQQVAAALGGVWQAAYVTIVAVAFIERLDHVTHGSPPSRIAKAIEAIEHGGEAAA